MSSDDRTLVTSFWFLPGNNGRQLGKKSTLFFITSGRLLLAHFSRLWFLPFLFQWFHGNQLNRTPDPKR